MMTMSTSNIYSAEPAHPVLAHSLLSQPTISGIHTAPPTQKPNPKDWKLDEEWNTGIKYGDSGIFRCGSVVGFSRLRMRSSDSDEYIGQIPRSLLIKHLQTNPPSVESNTFIIYPSTFDAFAARSLFHDLQAGASALSKDDAIKRLDAVQLFPVTSLSSAAQAISQVSDILQEAQDKHHEVQEQPNSNKPIIILIVAGLDTLAEGVIRASNPARGTAVLASTLRMITRLSRTHSDFLTTLLVNSHGLGSYVDFNQDGSRGQATSPDTRPSREDGIHSIFQAPGTPILSTLLMRTLDQGIDTHILLSDAKYAHVAEVIKDRVGTALGKWTTWSLRR